MGGAEVDANFFRRLTIRWQEVPINGDNDGIATVEFCAAGRELVKIIDVLGGVAFGPVRNDMNNNLGKLEHRYKSSPDKCKTLQEMVLLEQSIGATGRETATISLLWYKRGMEFLETAFKYSLANPEEELSESFGKSYEQTLSKHHNFMIRGVSSLALKASPWRKDFYARLGTNQEQLLVDMTEYFSAYSKICRIIVKFYLDHNLEPNL